MMALAAFAGCIDSTDRGDRSDIPEANNPPAKEVTVSVESHGDLALAGPFTHENLALYILRSNKKQPTEPDYITLEEGLKAGTVTVTESEQEQVQQLLVTNKSDNPLYIQVGELVTGGKQDRTMQSSLVIPPNSGPTPIPSFCVEQGRWSGSKQFSGGYNYLPSNALKMSVQAGNQSVVWHNVAAYKSAARTLAPSGAAAAESTSSSVNEELESKPFKKLLEEYQLPLSGVLDELDNPVGLAFAVNGKISTIDIYHSSKLFKKLFPKLLHSAAAEAIGNKTEKKDFDQPTAQDVRDFTVAAWDAKERKGQLENDNIFLRISNDKAFASQLSYQARFIHSQVLSKDADLGKGAALESILQNHPEMQLQESVVEPQQAPNPPAPETER